MKTALIVVFALSYLLAVLRSITDKVSTGAGILSSVIAVTSAACMMILTYFR